jgi:spore maturation protein CgeB
MIVEPYYRMFLNDVHLRHPELSRLDYEESLRTLLSHCMGTGAFYAENLERRGHRVTIVLVNDEVLEAKWARENGMRVVLPASLDTRVSKNRYLRRLLQSQKWLVNILAERIREERPDVLFITGLIWCDSEFARKIRPFVRLIVGQIATSLPPEKYIRSYDLIVSSFPHFVDRFRSIGVASEYLKLGFEATILNRLETLPDRYDAVFVGGISGAHSTGTATLEELAAKTDLDVWGYGVETLLPESPLRRKFHGHSWGLDMYNVLHNSRLVVNRHVGVAENFANNLRLYESTGTGALLVTDEKDNLCEIFEVGKEVVSYGDTDDLVEKVRYYLGHEEERASIARAGQERTLRDHTYSQRMQDLEEIFEAYM